MQQEGGEEALAPRLVSVQVGLPKSYGVEGAEDPFDRPWTTGFFKQPVSGPVYLTSTGLAGDGVADRRWHGGPEMAVLAYCAEHYSAWRSETGLAEMSSGGFGENLTISGLAEADVCIGDVFAIGAARIQISVPRAPCRAIDRRWRRRGLCDASRKSGRVGWYCRVLQEGALEAGQDVVLLERPLPRWSVARVHEVRHHSKEDLESAAALAACELLAQEWRGYFAERLVSPGTSVGRSSG
jgi:MOSC domain-containing protein YiiM